MHVDGFGGQPGSPHGAAAGENAACGEFLGRASEQDKQLAPNMRGTDHADLGSAMGSGHQVPPGTEVGFLEPELPSVQLADWDPYEAAGVCLAQMYMHMCDTADQLLLTWQRAAMTWYFTGAQLFVGVCMQGCQIVLRLTTLVPRSWSSMPILAGSQAYGAGERVAAAGAGAAAAAAADGCAGLAAAGGRRAAAGAAWLHPPDFLVVAAQVDKRAATAGAGASEEQSAAGVPQAAVGCGLGVALDVGVGVTEDDASGGFPGDGGISHGAVAFLGSQVRSGLQKSVCSPFWRQRRYFA